MRKKIQTNAKGFAHLVLILFALILIAVVIGLALFFLKKSNTSSQSSQAKPSASGSVTENKTIDQKDLPLQVCTSGDPENCNDPIPPSKVDNAQIEDGP